VVTLPSLPLCQDPLCTGHLGKFTSCRSEALWVASLEGFDKTTGNTEAHGHFALLHFPEDQDIDVSDNPCWQHNVTVPCGWYIVETQESGAVYHAEYDTEEEARKAFSFEEARYGEWLNVNEPED
jgi:hypothetical protein